MAKAAGNFKPLEEYPGFCNPYNDLCMAIMHGFFPFPFNIYQTSQKKTTGCSSDDRVVAHPWVLANGREAQEEEVYAG